MKKIKVKTQASYKQPAFAKGTKFNVTHPTSSGRKRPVFKTKPTMGS